MSNNELDGKEIPSQQSDPFEGEPVATIKMPLGMIQILSEKAASADLRGLQEAKMVDYCVRFIGAQAEAFYKSLNTPDKGK
jgi:hypothetical protein